MLQENFTSNEPFAQSVGYSPSVFLALWVLCRLWVCYLLKLQKFELLTSNQDITQNHFPWTWHRSWGVNSQHHATYLFFILFTRTNIVLGSPRQAPLFLKTWCSIFTSTSGSALFDKFLVLHSSWERVPNMCRTLILYLRCCTLILATALQERHHYLHFTGERTEAQRGSEACPRPQLARRSHELKAGS